MQWKGKTLESYIIKSFHICRSNLSGSVSFTLKIVDFGETLSCVETKEHKQFTLSLWVFCSFAFSFPYIRKWIGFVLPFHFECKRRNRRISSNLVLLNSPKGCENRTKYMNNARKLFPIKEFVFKRKLYWFLFNRN